MYVGGVDVSPEGKVVVAGYFSGTLAFDKPGGVNPIAAPVPNSAFLHVINTEGEGQWANYFEGSTLSLGRSCVQFAPSQAISLFSSTSVNDISIKPPPSILE